MCAVIYRFNYKNHEDCYILEGRYKNGNLGLTLYDEDGKITDITYNTHITIPEDYIAVKDYGNNKGMVDFLKSINLIVDDPVYYINTEHTFVPVYRLTDLARELVYRV